MTTNNQEFVSVPTGDPNAKQALLRLGPFTPPAAYAFEPELQGPTPRRIPDEFRDGRYARRRRSSMLALLISGIVCLVLGLLPIVRFMGLFFLPLCYLSWIGVALLIVWMVRLGLGLVRRGPYEYVEDGTTLVVRITSLLMQPHYVQHGEVSSYKFTALLQYRDPQTGELTSAASDSHQFSSIKKLNYTTSYRVGDYATAVYLPRDPQKTLQLYGFLDLKPNLGVIDRDAADAPGTLQHVGVVLIVLACFAALAWNMYALERYQPISMETWQWAVPVVAGALGLGGLMGYLIWRDKKKTREKIARRNAAALIEGTPVELDAGPAKPKSRVGRILTGIAVVFGCGLLGGLTVLCLAFTVNAVFDNSPPRPELVQVSNKIQETHKGIVNIYKIKYRRQGDPGEHSILSTPDEMDAYLVNQLASAELHDGWLGWPWVKQLTPVMHVRQPEQAPPDAARP